LLFEKPHPKTKFHFLRVLKKLGIIYFSPKVYESFPNPKIRERMEILLGK